MANATPALTIRIRPSDTEKAFIFEDSAGRSVAVGSKTAFEQAVFEQAGLRQRLELLRSVGEGALTLSPADADKALAGFYEAGKLVQRNLLGNDLVYAQDVSGIVR